MVVASQSLLLPPISAAAGGTLYQQIIDGLRREISEGRLAGDSALPSFRQLAEDLQVSVITVKRAYEELEREGLIYRRQGLGTFVSSGAPDRSRQLKKARAVALLRQAVQEAGEAGLAGDDIMKMVREVLAAEGELTHVRKRR